MVQQFVNAPTDLLSLGSGFTPLTTDRPVNEFHYYPTPDPHVYSWEFIVRDLSFGLNMVWGHLKHSYGSGDCGPDSHRLSSSTLNPSYPGQAVLPFLATNQGASGAAKWMGWAEIDGSVCFGGGSTSGSALGAYLYPAPGVGSQFGFVTYNPAAVISCVEAIVIGGVTNAKRFIVGKVGAVADVLSSQGIPGSAAATSAGSMDAATSSLWGIMTSGLNASNPGIPVHGLYAGGGFYTLAASAAIAGVPTQVATLPAGGYTVGPIFFKGWPARAFMVVPKSSQTNGMFNTTEPGAADLWHCSLEFNDPQPMTDVPLRSVVHAIRWRNMLVVSDGLRNVLYDGANWSDLGWVTDREPNNLIRYRNVGFQIIHDDLHCWSFRDNAGNTANNRVALERYDPETKQWNQIGESLTPSTYTSVSNQGRWAMGGKATSYPVGRGLPVNEYESQVVMPTLGEFFTAFVSQSGYSPFNNWRQTTGAGGATNNTVAYAANGTARSVAMQMPPVPGGGHAVHVVEQVDPQGDVPAGLGTGKMQLQLATQTSTGFSFSNNLVAQVLAADRLMRDPTRFLDNEAFFNRLQYQLYLERDGTTTTVTPNGTPFTLRGLSFAHGKKPVSPRAFWRSVGQGSKGKVA